MLYNNIKIRIAVEIKDHILIGLPTALKLKEGAQPMQRLLKRTARTESGTCFFFSFNKLQYFNAF